MRRALILLALVPLAVGCGAKESGLAGSEKAMRDAGSSRIEMTMIGEELGFSATGSIDYARDRGELVITSEEMEIPGGEMRGRFIGGTTYVGWTLLGKPRWEKESDYTPSGTERFVPGPGGPNPDQLLGLLIKASKEVETLDKEEIRGVPTRHHRAHLDKKKLGEDASVFPGEVVIEAWIDDDGLVRRLRVPYGLGETTLVDFFDFGIQVDVEAPPAAEIVTEEELWKLMEKECEQMPREKQRKSIFCEGGIHAFESEPAPAGTVPAETK